MTQPLRRRTVPFHLPKPDCGLGSEMLPPEVEQSYVMELSIIYIAIADVYISYEPADLTVHPPPELPRVGSFFSYRCLVFPKKCPQRKACAFRSYSG